LRSSAFVSIDVTRDHCGLESQGAALMKTHVWNRAPLRRFYVFTNQYPGSVWRALRDSNPRPTA
jgi:hypothetical protein